MANQWTVSVAFMAAGNLASTFAKLNEQATTLNRTLKATGQVNEAQLASMEARLSSMRSTLGKWQLGVAAGLGGFVTMGVKGAMDLQSTLVDIQNATGASVSQMNQVRNIVYDISNRTAQSVNDSAKIVNVIASSGFNDIKQLLGNKDFMMHIASFSDVAFLNSKGSVSFSEGAKQAIQLAHLYRAYSPKDIDRLTDLEARANLMMPDTLSKFITQAGYYQTAFDNLHVDPTQSFALGIMLDRVGLGRGKGGTALAHDLEAGLGPLALTKSNGASVGILNKLGILSGTNARFYNNGQFDMVGMFEQLYNDSRRYDGRTFQQMMREAFGEQGQRTASLFGDKRVIDQLHQIIKGLNTLPGAEAQQKAKLDTAKGSLQRAITNIQSLATSTFYDFLNPLAGFFRGVADMAHNVQQFLNQHPTGRMVTSVALVLTTIRFAIGALINMGLISKSLITMPGEIDALSMAIERLRASSDIATAKITEDAVIMRDSGILDQWGKPFPSTQVRTAEKAAEEATSIAGRSFWSKAGNWLWKALDWVAFGIPSLLRGAAVRILGAFGLEAAALAEGAAGAAAFAGPVAAIIATIGAVFLLEKYHTQIAKTAGTFVDRLTDAIDDGFHSVFTWLSHNPFNGLGPAIGAWLKGGIPTTNGNGVSNDGAPVTITGITTWIAQRIQHALDHDDHRWHHLTKHPTTGKTHGGSKPRTVANINITVNGVVGNHSEVATEILKHARKGLLQSGIHTQQVQGSASTVPAYSAFAIG